MACARLHSGAELSKEGVRVRQYLPAIVYLAGLVVGVGVLYLWLWRAQRARRRTPLTKELLRGPGQSLRARIDELTFDLVAYFAALPGLPLLFYALHLEQRLLGVSNATSVILYALIAGALVAFVAVKLVQTLSRLRRFRLALEAELATGQELDQLMRQGYRVFHDVPADGFNIDHVVVGRNGVFAIETKARTKPVKGDGKAEWKVEYNGEMLVFPSHREVKPLEQAERQAKWLREWLSAAVGEPVPVTPVLALPGWYINRTRAGGVAVFNAAHPAAFFRRLGNAELSDKLQQQIAHQLEQRCRDVAPRAYPRKKKTFAGT